MYILRIAKIIQGWKDAISYQLYNDVNNLLIFPYLNQQFSAKLTEKLDLSHWRSHWIFVSFMLLGIYLIIHFFPLLQLGKLTVKEFVAQYDMDI